MIDFLTQLDENISGGGTRVGALYYSSQSMRAFNVNEYRSTDGVISAIDTLIHYKSKSGYED